MAIIEWDKQGERLFETGTDQGVLYPRGGTAEEPIAGVPWNGLTAVNEAPEGAEETKLWADNMNYVSLYSAEIFKFTIEAYTYPAEFEVCDGSAEIAPGVTIGQQNRKPFDFSYRTLVGNDEELTDFGEKIHLVWNAKASPSERAYATVNDSPEAATFSWECGTTPVKVAGYKPTATMVFDSTKTTQEVMQAIKDRLYGTDTKEASMPTLAEAIEIAKGSASKTSPQPSEQ